MRAVQLLMMIVFVGSCGWAQDPNYAALKPAAITLPASVESASVPAAPEPQKKVVDKKFLFVMGGLATAEAMRITTTTLVLDREAAEGAPWVSAPPAHGNLIAKNGLIFASELLAAYELKKPHSWLPGDKVIRRLVGRPSGGGNRALQGCCS